MCYECKGFPAPSCLYANIYAVSMYGDLSINVIAIPKIPALSGKKCHYFLRENSASHIPNSLVFSSHWTNSSICLSTRSIKIFPSQMTQISTIPEMFFLLVLKQKRRERMDEQILCDIMKCIIIYIRYVLLAYLIQPCRAHL